MASMQEFFTYECKIIGCRLKGLEMAGMQADWDHLLVKLQQVEEQLKPIIGSLDLDDSWFRHVEHVFRNLAKTYVNPESQEVCDFWADVLMEGSDWKYGPSGFGGHSVASYNGWLIRFLIGKEKLWKEDLSDKNVREQLKGLNSVPMEISLTYVTPVITDSAELKAGIIGFTIHAPENTFNQVPSVELTHMWAMMLPENSPLRSNKKAKYNDHF